MTLDWALLSWVSVSPSAKWGSSCCSSLQLGWAETRSSGLGVVADGQTGDTKGRCHPRLGEMRLDSGETRPWVMKYVNKERHQLQVWLVLSSD